MGIKSKINKIKNKKQLKRLKIEAPNRTEPKKFHAIRFGSMFQKVRFDYGFKKTKPNRIEPSSPQIGRAHV